MVPVTSIALNFVAPTIATAVAVFALDPVCTSATEFCALSIMPKVSSMLLVSVKDVVPLTSIW